MYNGIGLPTPRGSGTNGYVSKNLAHVNKGRQFKHNIVSKPDPTINEPPNLELVLHKKKREIEAKCLKLREELEDEGWNKDTIDKEVNRYRNEKLEALTNEMEKSRSG